MIRNMYDGVCELLSPRLCPTIIPSNVALNRPGDIGQVSNDKESKDVSEKV